MNSLGEIVKILLNKKKMSQKELCLKTGISESAMSKYLSKDSYPRTEVLINIANSLDVPINVLLGKEEDIDTYTVCKTALFARSGKKLTAEQKNELIKLILED